jgi:hypothetical protein
MTIEDIGYWRIDYRGEHRFMTIAAAKRWMMDKGAPLPADGYDWVEPVGVVTPHDLRAIRTLWASQDYGPNLRKGIRDTWPNITDDEAQQYVYETNPFKRQVLIAALNEREEQKKETTHHE